MPKDRIEKIDDELAFELAPATTIFSCLSKTHTLPFLVTKENIRTSNEQLFISFRRNNTSCRMQTVSLYQAAGIQTRDGMPISSVDALQSMFVLIAIRLVKIHQTQETHSLCVAYNAKTRGGASTRDYAMIILNDAIEKGLVVKLSNDAPTDASILDIGSDTIDLKSVSFWPTARRVPGAIVFPTIAAYSCFAQENEYW